MNSSLTIGMSIFVLTALVMYFQGNAFGEKRDRYIWAIIFLVLGTIGIFFLKSDYIRSGFPYSLLIWLPVLVLTPTLFGAGVGLILSRKKKTHK